MIVVRYFIVGVLLSSMVVSNRPSLAAETKVQHPFILWTKSEAAAIRRVVETEPWAKAKYDELLSEKGVGQTFRNLFRYTVMQDESVFAAEKKYLLDLIGKHPKNFLGDTGGGRHYDQYLDVLRYDAFYDRLTDDERKSLEDTFRVFIDHHLHEETLQFTRTSWLPNMQWPRPMTAHLMAVALRDEQLVREVFASRGGWKYYFDDYLADGQFYGEEFGKQYSMIGEMFLWCRGVERLGLNDLGYGYRGRGGATMRRYLESILALGYPRVDIPQGMPHYPQVTMGDAKGHKVADAPPYVFQHSIVLGRMPGKTTPETAWMAANMNGRDHKNTKVDKMLAPHWFEMAHAQWPDGHFDYFLVQMREPGADRYIPSLYWGVKPILASRVTPPPAPSFVAKERGFALLRAEESPAYWESPAPAVAFQQATYYVHYAHDAFSLLGYYAFNRPIYLNRQISNGYGGGCPWSDSMRGHCGVLVDNLQYELNEANPKADHPHWPNPIGEVPVRSGFDRLVKFVAARAVCESGKVTADNQQPLSLGTLSLDLRRNDPQVWPDVEMSRALFLTREYLFDVFQLTSDKPHIYHWQVHTLGSAQWDDSWKPTNELTGRLYDEQNRGIAARLADPVEHDRYQLKQVRKLRPGDHPWTFTALQTCALPDVSSSVLGRPWYERQVGVRVHMLGEPNTAVFVGQTPESRRVKGREPNKGEKSELGNEVGGVTLIAARQCPSTVFAAIHEPFEHNQPHIKSVRRIQQNTQGIAIAITGGRDTQRFDDRLLYRYWPDYDQPLIVAGDGESFTFADRAYIRITADRIEVSGDLRALTLKVSGRPKLVVNGREQPVVIDKGVLTWSGFPKK